MAIFKSTPAPVRASAEAVYNKLSDLSNLRSLMSRIPESAIPADKKEMFDSVRITEDSIIFPAGPVGEVNLRLSEKINPTLIRFEGIGTPVPLTLSLLIGILSADTCEACVEFDIAIPAMLKPMIGGTIQKMADQFAQVITSLNYE